MTDLTDDSSASDALREGPGTQLGPYKLLQQLGEGGFGVVFLAEQRVPVARQVALKIIKLGMDTRQVVARFEQERHALALMDHPNIARVIDAGATETGRPYFVMELVKGAPIVEYCDKNSLSIPERLELFEQVCAAVQHAHQKGIIHRDLKPSNVLVATQDGKAQAKVIDFGVAKATSAKLTDKTLFTEHMQVIGTLQYMSPEQAEGSLDIDTRTDVYALGVILYELLTGSTPFDPKTLRDALYSEIQRMIREVEPPKPSTRLSTSLDTLAGIAARRRVEPGRLGTLLRGELDWIVMKALEKDRARRYESASGLALDIGRFRRGEAVHAAPVSAAYRLRKFVRRNRGAVFAGAAVALALLVGAVGFAWQARLASEQRDRAVLAEKETRLRADELQQVASFQSQMLEQIDPSQAGMWLAADVQTRYEQALAADGISEEQRKTKAEGFAAQWQRVNATDTARLLIDRTILKPAVAAIDKQFGAQPAVAARLRHSLAALYQGMGLLDAALPLQEQALATRRQVLGAEQADTLDSQNRLVCILIAQASFERAEICARDAFEKSVRVLGQDHPYCVTARGNLGYLCFLEGKLDEAEPLCRQALEDGERVEGPENLETLTFADNLARLLLSQGKNAEAEALFRTSLARSRHALGEDHPLTLIGLNNLGHALALEGRFAEMEVLFRETLERQRRVHGAEHPDTITAIQNLGFSIQNQGRLAEAEVLQREALEKCGAMLGERHPDSLTARNNLGLLLQDEGKLTEAEPYLRTVLDLRRQVLGEDHADTLASIGNLGRLYLAQERYADAEPLLREALEKKRRLRGEEHPDTLTSINNLGALFEAEGQAAEAEPYFRDAMEKCRRVLGPEHPNTFITTINTGTALVWLGRPAEALELLAPIEAPARQAFTGAYGRWLAKLLVSLGRAHAATGEYPLAESALLEGHSLFVTTRGGAHKDTRAAAQALFECYQAWNAAQPDAARAAKAAEWKAKLDAGR
ncbi:MAG: tetratricopeptide repeat protein [Planctomycetes bacterium]|nr:tetratricopeptide repeat protein [Planctomycetota bacterium]